VTNAVRHAGGADRVTVIHDAQILRIEVHDLSPAVPRERPGGRATGTSDPDDVRSQMIVAAPAGDARSLGEGA